MAENESFGIMPASELNTLRKEVKQLQSRDKEDSEHLLKSVITLTKNMDSMLGLFKNAVDEMRLEEQEEKALSHQIQPLMGRINELLEQNKIIAEGMVAIADLIKERIPDSGIKSRFPTPEIRQSSSFSSNMPPPNLGTTMPPPPSMPPPPPKKEF